MNPVTIVDSDIDSVKLHEAVTKLILDNGLHDHNQISLTSIDGNDDWLCNTGKIHLLKYPERFYSNVNKSLENTYIADCLARYPDFYRWRLLRLNGRSAYSIHSDRNAGDKDNIRLHIPVVTNKGAFLCFYDNYPKSGHTSQVLYEHLEAGKSYRVNTTGLHTAVNHSTETRYHIVGVKYESSNNRSR